MAVSKRLRFEVLRRDGFTCRYCGAKAPDATLTVDHVTPVVLGGRDEPANLVAACTACNAGKSSTPADAALVADVNAEALQWASSVRSALVEIGTRDTANSRAAGALVEFWYTHAWPFSRERARCGLPVEVDLCDMRALSEYEMPVDGQLTIERFLRYGLPKDAISLAMERATYMTPGVAPCDAFRYFCGICWRTIREAEDTIKNGDAR